MGLDFSKLGAKLQALAQSSTKKIEVSKMTENLQKAVENSGKKLPGTFESSLAMKNQILATQAINKPIVKDFDITKVIENHRLKNLAKEGIKSGLNAQQALNGAKEVIASMGQKSGKSAAVSADVFIENGLTNTEKAINKAEEAAKTAAKMAERKAELMKKYGDKLPEVLESKRIAKENEILNKLLEQ